MERRSFIKLLTAAGILSSTSLFFSCGDNRKKLNILILGGTNFVGPAIVNIAKANQHNITLFNRGKSNPNLFPDIELIKGDRKEGVSSYESLAKKKWDVVIDVWPEKSRLVEEATKVLKDHARHYVFVSSIAVYNNFQEVGLHEKSDVVSLALSKEEWMYPEEKLAAENIVREHFPDNHTILRPGPIKGWRDSAYDLLYWILKLSKNETVIAPGSGKDPIQFINVKDVARFAIMAAENNLSGTYNIVGPQQNSILWKEFLEITKTHLGSKSDLYWADEAFLKKNKVMSFSDLPLWAPLSEDRGFMQISNNKLTKTGFKFIPLTKTIDDCFDWYKKEINKELNFGTKDVNIGLERGRELKLIEMLKERKAT